jgi:hypothetical protein
VRLSWAEPGTRTQVGRQAGRQAGRAARLYAHAGSDQLLRQPWCDPAFRRPWDTAAAAAGGGGGTASGHGLCEQLVQVTPEAGREHEVQAGRVLPGRQQPDGAAPAPARQGRR